MNLLKEYIRSIIDTHCLFFAYGYYLEPNNLKKVCPSCIPIGQAILPDYSFRFNAESPEDPYSWGNAVYQPDGKIYGMLYYLDSADLENLDSKEAGYHRVNLPVRYNKKTVNAQVYINHSLNNKPVPVDYIQDIHNAGIKQFLPFGHRYQIDQALAKK